MLPFDTEVLFSFFAQYNRAVWPAQIIAYALALAALALVFKPVAGGGRLIGLILVAAWAWTGALYHLTYFATIDFAAPVLGGVFLLQALLLFWTGAVRGRLAFRFRPDLFGWAGLALVIVALAYPLLDRLAGHDWASGRIAGLAPAPTAVFTLGLLLLGEGRTPYHLLVIPLLWSLVGAATAWELIIPQEVVLPLAGLAALGLAPWKNRRHARARSDAAA